MSVTVGLLRRLAPGRWAEEAPRVAYFESPAITDILNSYRRIKDHAFNVAEVVADEK